MNDPRLNPRLRIQGTTAAVSAESSTTDDFAGPLHPAAMPEAPDGQVIWRTSLSLVVERSRMIRSKRLVAPDEGEAKGKDEDEEVTLEKTDSDEDDAWQAPQYFLTGGQSDPSELVEAENLAEDSMGRLHVALADLDDRSRDILERRWLLDDKSTLHELAAEYQVSAERIRQLEANALKKLRTAMVA